MIAAVKAWFAVFAALLCIFSKDGRAADDLSGAARAVARRTAAFAGSGDAVTVIWRNLSSLPANSLAEARAVFEAALRDAGAQAGTAGAIEERITLSESESQYLLVAEARKGDERQTFIASWKRGTATSPALRSGTISLERKLLWEQAAPILDLALTPSGMLVLSPAKLTLYTRRDAAMEERQSASVAPVRPWPRDPRARLRLAGNAFKAFLPGTLCTGAIEPELTVECHASEEPWTLDSGSRAVMLATFAPGRNYFDGGTVLQNGVRKTAPPFYTAGSIEDQGRQFWLLSLIDGRTGVYDANLELSGSFTGWGSDIAGTDARCGSGSQILATKADDEGEPDSIRAYSLVNRGPVPLSTPVEFGGPVTALWTFNGVAALAVARDLSTGLYAAYVVTVICGG